MTNLNVSRDNRVIFLKDHNFLGLGKLSTTVKRLSVKTATKEKKRLRPQEDLYIQSKRFHRLTNICTFSSVIT